MAVRSTTAMILFTCAAISLAQNGRAAASYAYYHTWDGYRQFDNDCAAFVSRAQRSGGWSYVYFNYPFDRVHDSVWYDFGVSSYTWGGTANFESHLNVSGRATLVRTVTPSTTYDYSNLFIEPGDIIIADWGSGNNDMPADRNRADGRGDHAMVIQQSLGNGDFLYCQHGGPGDAKMRRLFDVLSLPNLRNAQYRIYHVNGNNTLAGLSENHMYRDANRSEVYVRVNAGLFWVPDGATVNFYGGWGNVTVLPSNTLANLPRLPIPGTMLKEINSPNVWLVEDYTKRWVRTAEAVSRLGGWPAVRVVPNGTMNRYFFFRGSDVLQ